ncbi:MAG: PDZ domain-containing protein, partial [Clostridia bacterium]|nr:PDZ domain-containing protein [Clostridia bacterium]
MLHKIKSVEDGSIADQLGLKPGDTIAKINNELIVDFIDYQALCCQEKIALEAVHDGETVVY